MLFNRNHGVFRNSFLGIRFYNCDWMIRWIIQNRFERLSAILTNEHEKYIAHIDGELRELKWDVTCKVQLMPKRFAASLPGGPK